MLLLAGCEDGATSTPLPTPLPTPEPGGETWWQDYFTDPNRINDPEELEGSIEEDLITRIGQAKESIHIAAFEFNLTPIAEALIAAHQNGVEVQWVTDDEHGLEADSEEDHGQFAMLQGADIEVRDDGRGALMHNKFIIFDDQTVWTGATNLTVNGIFRNNNNAIVIESPAVAAMYEGEFDEMWSGEFGPTSPSILLMMVPLMPTLPLAAANLLLRFSISQMDVPTRQSYTMAVVTPDERSAASGVTAIARSLGASISPALTGWLIDIPVLFSAPFFLSGGLKIVYDLLLYREFRAVKPPEEKA